MDWKKHKIIFHEKNMDSPHLRWFLGMILPKKKVISEPVSVEHIWEQSSLHEVWLDGSPFLKCFGKSLVCSCMRHFNENDENTVLKE